MVSYTGDPLLWPVTGQLAVVLLAGEPWLSRRSRLYTHLCLAVQAGIAVALALISPRLGFYAILLISLTPQAVHVFQPRIGFRWIGTFVLVMTALMFYGQESGTAEVWLPPNRKAPVSVRDRTFA